MLTECPSCLTVFRVTGAILKMGHGQVRCGKCRTQFDALDSLLDDSGEDEKNPVTQNETTQSPNDESAIEAQAPAMGEDIVMEGSRIEISGTYRVPDDESAAHASNAANQIIHEHVVIDRGAPLADNLLAGMSDADAMREAADEQVFEINVDDGEPVADAAQHLMPDSTSGEQASVPLSQRLWKRGRHKSTQQGAVTDAFDEELNSLIQTPKTPTVRAGWWTAVSATLVVVLIAQVIHHHRDPLVRSPKWGETVSRVYRALGLNLTPQWDLHAYELQQWGVISDASARDALRVRASVTNTAAYAQPYPFVKLALEDRWGAIVAMREFAPEEYLPSIATANRMMAPRQRTNAEIVIVDPGADAVGFQIRACLPQGPGLVCSDDPSVGE